ncbi:MAG: acetylxylan esterase [Bryobacterales bacterium]|nr:acetylxylan esterase [Bryobacterales bacterium]
MRSRLAAGVLITSAVWGQADVRRLRPVLEAQLVAPEVVQYQLQRYLKTRVPTLPAGASAADWTRQASQLRHDILDNIVFHGWPRDWVNAPLKFEDRGFVEGTGKGYRIRKLRYEIVPGMWTSALLYEPEQVTGRIPAILNVNGHVGPPGKAVEYKQKRCINQALQGIFALNVEWLSFGEMDKPGNVHWYGAHLDLAGANGVGLFYLAMRKGLDFLAQHTQVDPKRLGVTGLSGGGWQTIVLSALDERVAVSVPVAGYSAVTARLERPGDIGDIEQNPTDFLVGRDYSHLTAMRAPRPTLLVYNAEDDCCFRAALVKPDIYDRVRPFFALYGASEKLAWHENFDPADHNYQLDNRQHSYAFFTRHFGLKETNKEVPVDAEVKTVDQLRVGLPEDNRTIAGVAKELAKRRETGQATRDRLRSVLRYSPVTVEHAWATGNTRSKGVETRSYRFDFKDGLSATAVLTQSLTAAEHAPATILLDDGGRRSMVDPVAERINRGERVLAANLLFSGDMTPKPVSPMGFSQLIATMGRRPLGLQAAHLTALAAWMGGKVRVHASGRRNTTLALAAAAIEPERFAGVELSSALTSFQDLLDGPVEYRDAPELFCLDLYRYFDIPDLRKLAGVR